MTEVRNATGSGGSRLRWMLATALLAAAAMPGYVAAQCTIDAWSGSTNVASTDVGSPIDDPSVPRYEGVCGLSLAIDGTTHAVYDNSPGQDPFNGVDQYRARFYTLLGDDNLQDGESLTVFRGFDSIDIAGNQQFSLDIENNGGTLQAVFNAGGTSVSQAFSTNRDWHSVEIQWDATIPEIALSTDDNTFATSTNATLSGTVNSVELGSIAGANTGGTIGFDVFESRQTQQVGRLMEGDANSDGAVNSGDLVAIVLDFLGSSQASGTPDCNEDGSVNSGDLVCVVLTFLGG